MGPDAERCRNCIAHAYSHRVPRQHPLWPGDRERHYNENHPHCHSFRFAGIQAERVSLSWYPAANFANHARPRSRGRHSPPCLCCQPPKEPQQRGMFPATQLPPQPTRAVILYSVYFAQHCLWLWPEPLLLSPSAVSAPFIQFCWSLLLRINVLFWAMGASGRVVILESLAAPVFTFPRANLPLFAERV